MLEHALRLARLGFRVFPLVEGGKLPLVAGWPDSATTDEARLRKWWTCPVTGFEQNYNVGICTTGLLVIDVDVKDGKPGNHSLLKLEIERGELPQTYTQTTPTGGRHVVYRAPESVRNSVQVLGPGLDVRGRHGFIVGAGSVTDRGVYAANDRTATNAPQWLTEIAGTAPARDVPTQAELSVDPARASVAAIEYLKTAPRAVQGQGGDATTFKVAARLKDLGVGEKDATSLMYEQWNRECEPPWDMSMLALKVSNAYRYGTAAPGSAAPEAQFEKVDHPFVKLNREYAFVLAGGGHHILWETRDVKGRYRLEHLAEASFHRAHASNVMQVGEKVEPVTRLWMGSKERRSYDGICFMPGGEAPPRWYNLWRGFSVQPAPCDAKARLLGETEDAVAVRDWLNHLEKNVCQGNTPLAKWLTGYFAHLVQRPAEKPLVALVLRGSKGVGKNALIELGVSDILGAHSLVVTDRRYLIGNFNGHLENLLLVAFDEAFWSGDKQAEGILKGLITGKSHVIEHKGKEPYVVDNRCRVVIIGNEDWLVPASHDERRFAVFDVGQGRKNDRAFFERMRQGMRAGGASLLLRYLLDFDLAGIDVNEAPATSGLLDQKTASMDPFHQWWFECLTEGRIVGSDFGGEWPEECDKERLRAAFTRYLRDRNIRTRLPEERSVGRALKKCAPSVESTKRTGGVYVYRMNDLAKHRSEWNTFIGHECEWK